MDVRDAQQRLIGRAKRLIRLVELSAPSRIVWAEIRLITEAQEAIDAANGVDSEAMRAVAADELARVEEEFRG